MSPEAKARLRAEEALRAVQGRGPKLERVAGEAGRDMATADTAVSLKQNDLAKAENAYADSPTDRSAKAIGKAREALNLAELRARKPRATKLAADQALDAWRSEAASAEGQLDQARKAERLAGLRVATSVDGFNARAEVPRQRLLTALEAVQAAASEIDALFAEANAAAAELTEAGFPTSELGDHHLIAPLVAAQAIRCPEEVGGLVSNLSQLAERCRGSLAAPTPPTLALHLRGPLLELIHRGGRGVTPPELVPLLAKRLDAALNGRTRADAIAARDGSSEHRPLESCF